MLRTSLMIVGVMMLAGAAVGWWLGRGFGGLAIPGGILVLALIGERYVYKPLQTDTPGPGWEQTGETFADPSSGRMVTVRYNPATGKRRYVAAPGS
jgi:hypothetical protein